MHFVEGQKVEFLSMTHGKTNEELVFVLTLRLQDQFKPINLLLKVKEAEDIAGAIIEQLPKVYQVTKPSIPEEEKGNIIQRILQQRKRRTT